MGKKRGAATGETGAAKKPKLAAAGPPLSKKKQPPPASARPSRSALKGGRGVVAGAPHAPQAAAPAPPAAENGPNSKARPKLDKGEPNKGKGKGKGKAEAPTKPVAGNNEQRPDYASFNIVFGSYERLLCGLSAAFDPSPSRPPTLTPLFHFPAHLSSVKALAASPNGKHLVTSAASDDNLKLWSLRSRREEGALVGAGGAVASLEFDRRGKVLIAADEAGVVAVFRTKDWVLLRRLRGHRGRINGTALHPHGRVLLTVGQDRCLRMWDLGAGRKSGSEAGKPVASAKLGKEGDRVAWDAAGHRFAVVCGGECTVHTTDMTKVCTFRAARGRLHDIAFYSPRDSVESYIVIGHEDSAARVYALPRAPLEDPDEPGRLVAELVGHTNRVKAVRIITLGPASHRPGATLAVTISSDGTSKVFPLPRPAGPSLPPPPPPPSPERIEAIASYDTKGSRPTCLCVVGVSAADAEREEAIASALRGAGAGTEGQSESGSGSGSGGGSESESRGQSDGSGEGWEGVDLDADGNPIALGEGEDEGEDEGDNGGGSSAGSRVELEGEPQEERSEDDSDTDEDD